MTMLGKEKFVITQHAFCKPNYKKYKMYHNIHAELFNVMLHFTNSLCTSRVGVSHSHEKPARKIFFKIKTQLA